MKFEIKNRFSGELIFSIETENWRFAVEAAIKAKANLSYANLSYANLSYANLSSADLSYANLSYANLSYANLSSANLSYANLSYANLSSADLSSADLSPIKHDFWEVLFTAPHEVAGLRLAIVDGRINGSTYNGECACLVGTIANIRGKSHNDLGKLTPNSDRPIERFFMGINKGDNPETNPCSKLVLEWLDEWAENVKVAAVGLGANAGALS